MFKYTKTQVEELLEAQEYLVRNGWRREDTHGTESPIVYVPLLEGYATYHGLVHDSNSVWAVVRGTGAPAFLKLVHVSQLELETLQ